MRGGNETVLVVEDESPVRWTVKNILEKHGYRVLEAAAGVDALAVWHQHHSDISCQEQKDTFHYSLQY